MSDRIARAFNRAGATRAVAIDISKTFNRVWHADLLHLFLGNKQLWVVLDEKSSQEFPS